MNRRLLGGLVVLVGSLLGSCAPAGLQSQSLVNSVRILASSADKSYAMPGATVNLTVLAYDGRPTQPEPMTIYWLPFVCENPTDDAYYACFPQIEKGVFAAGAAGGLGPGVDLTPFLDTGPQYSFTMPADAVTSHAIVPGTPVPYGIAILFNIACAGHLEIVPIDPSNVNPETVPLGCFDSQNNQLGPNDYVFGYTRVYAYDTLTNANPVIDHVDVNGQTLAVTADSLGQSITEPVTTSPCTGKCQPVHIGPVVPASSQEVDPEQMLPGGGLAKEEIWADFFVTFGSVGNDARLLYDSTTGSVGGPSVTDVQFTPPATPGNGTFWAVVHDNRGGASWVTVPLQVQ